MSSYPSNPSRRRSTRKRSLPQGLSAAYVVEPTSKRARIGRASSHEGRVNEDVGEDEDGTFEVEMILARSLKLQRASNRRQEYHYLVRWRGYGPEEDTWEPASGLRSAWESVEEYRKQQRPYTILDADQGELFLVQHGITNVRVAGSIIDISESPLFETEWATADELKEIYSASGVTLSVRMFMRDDENRKRDEGNVVVNGQRNWRRNGSRRLQYSVCWQEDGQEHQEWLAAAEISRFFPKTGPPALSDYRKGANVVKAEPLEAENDYDRERLNNIALNRSLLRELGL